MNEIKSFDRVAEVYDQTRGMPEQAANAVAGGLLAIVRRVAPAPRLLEVGVGTGRIAVPLARAGLPVTGVDVSPRMLAVLRSKRGGVDALLAEAAHLPFHAVSFDAVLFVHVLHLVPDAEAAIREALRLMRPGGMLLLAQDERYHGARAEAEAAIRAAVREVAGVEIRGYAPYEESAAAFQRILSEAGAAIERTMLAAWTETASAREVMERLERRDWSSLWGIPEAALPAIIARVRPLVEGVFGGADRELETTRSFSVIAARLPG